MRQHLAWFLWAAVLILFGASCEREARDTVLVIHPQGVSDSVEKLQITTTHDGWRTSLPTEFLRSEGFAELDLRLSGGVMGYLYLDASAIDGLGNIVARATSGIDVIGVGRYEAELKLKIVEEQEGWAWCHKCQGLFFKLNGDSFCPAGGAHEVQASLPYILHHGAPLPDTQEGWRWCRKCQGLHDSTAPGVCPADGKSHDTTGSFLYLLRTKQDGDPSHQQDRWRRCSACAGLFFIGNPYFSCSGRQGGHDPTASDAFFLDY